LPQGSMDVQHNNELVQIQLSGNRQWTGKGHQLDSKSAGVTSCSENGRLQATKWVTIASTMQVIPTMQTTGTVTQSFGQTAMSLLLPQSCDCGCYVVSILFSHVLNLCPSLWISDLILHPHKSI
jgi:hypothetical protein